MLRKLAERIAGPDEGTALADEAERWIAAHFGPEYPWPGNVRELEQCLRNVMVRGEYRPGRRESTTSPASLVAAVTSGALTADELVRRYCALVFQTTGSYQETARRVGLDRRTVKDKVNGAAAAAAGDSVRGSSS